MTMKVAVDLIEFKVQIFCWQMKWKKFDCNEMKKKDAVNLLPFVASSPHEICT